MSNITKTHKVGLFAVMFIAAALVGSVIAFGDNMAFATKKHNDSEQEIEQDKKTNRMDNVYLEISH